MPASRERFLRPYDHFGVHDLVGVALLGEEPLPLGRELLVVGVTGASAREKPTPVPGRVSEYATVAGCRDLQASTWH